MSIELRKNHIVAFIDVLGYRALLKSREHEKIKTYFKTVIDEIEILKNFDTKRKLEYVLITDAVVLIFPFADQISNLKPTILPLCKFIIK